MPLTEKEIGRMMSLCAEVVTLAARVGDFINRERDRFRPDQVESKGKHDFVSYVDRAAERMLLDVLSVLLPEAGILSEEGGGVPKLGEYNWIVDPLDGTTNFIHGLCPHAVSIALSKGDEVVLGVIHEVGLGETFHAVAGHGAFLGVNPIQASACVSVQDALIATGFPYSDYERMGPFFETMDHLMRHSHGMRRLGSAATDLAYVACGRVDAFYEYSLKPWDVAAGSVIAREAGAIISDFGGGDHYLYGGEILCAAPGIFKEFQGLISGMMTESHG